MQDPTLLGIPAALLVVLLVQGAKKLGVRNGQVAWTTLLVALLVSVLMALAGDAAMESFIVKPILTALLLWLAAIGLYQFKPTGHNKPMEDENEQHE